MTSTGRSALLRVPRVRTLRPPSLDTVYGTLLVGVGVGIAAWIWQANPNYWYDEAMLVQALRAEGWLPPGVPMSQYEQAAPYGAYLLQKAMVSLVGFRENVLRLPGLLAFVASGVVVWRGARHHVGPATAWLAGLLTLTAGVAVRQAGQFKHYEYELLAAAVVLSLGLRLLAPDVTRRHTAAFVTAGIVTLAFSNSSVIVVGTTATVVLTAWLLRPGIPRAEVSRLATGTLAVAAVFAGWYLLVLRPAFQFQLAYPAYGGPATPGSFRDLLALLPVPSGTFMSAFWIVALGGGTLAVLTRRDLRPVVAVASAAVPVAAAAAISGAVPFAADRHLLFLVPGLALLAACGAAAIVGLPLRGRPPRLVTAVALIAAAYTAWAIVPATAGNGIATNQAFGYALTSTADRCSVWWVDWWSQPSATLYADRAGLSDRVLGTVPAASGAGQNAWAFRLQNAPAAWQSAMVERFQQDPRACLLIGSRPDEVPLAIAPLDAAGLACTRFAQMPDTELWSCEPRHPSPSPPK